MKIDNVEKLVKQALERNKSAREDDHLLYIEVVYIIDPGLVNVNFMMNFKNASPLLKQVFFIIIFFYPFYF